MYERIAAGVALLVLVGSTSADTISDDRLCQAIGNTPNDAVPPQDRAFFEDNCFCYRGDCAYRDSPRYKTLSATAACVTGAVDRLKAKVPSEELTSARMALVEISCALDPNAEVAAALVLPEMSKSAEVNAQRRK